MAEPTSAIPGWTEAIARNPDKATYLEAVAKCPDLVERESNPVWFVNFEGGNQNVDAAATRLCLYWKERKAIFGEAKAFLPLQITSSGECALWEEDMELLNSKAYAMIPPDSKGRPVLCIDLARSEKKQNYALAHSQAEMRLAFYFAALKLATVPIAVTQGVHLIWIARSLRVPTNWIKGNLATIDRAMPFRIHRFHLCPVVSQREWKFMRGLIPMLTKEFNELLPGRSFAPMASGPSQITLVLSVHDLRPQGLPESLGGQWSYDSIDDDGSSSLDKKMSGGTMHHEISLATVVSSQSPQDEVVETAELIEQSTQDMLKAIAEMNEKDKAAYLEAVEKAPEIVQTESDPVWFLRAVRFDAERAAIRLLHYWRRRKKAFGDRAFRSVLDISGEGALSQEDIAVMQTGFCVRLARDSKGREVVLTDTSRVNKKTFSFSKSGIRIWFCLVAQCSKNPLTQTDGIVGIRLETNSIFQPDSLRRELVKIKDTFPGILHHFHVCYSAGSGSVSRVGVPPILISTLASALPGKSTAHLWISGAGSFEGLHEHGIPREGLPPSLGGTWSFEDKAQESHPMKDTASSTKAADATMKSRKAGELETSDDAKSVPKRHKSDVPQASSTVLSMSVEGGFGGVGADDSAAPSQQVDSVLRAIRLAVDGGGVEPSAPRSKKVDSVVHAVRQAKQSTGLTVRDVLREAAARRSTFSRQTPRTTLPVESSVTQELDQVELKKLIEKESAKKRLLQKFLASKKYGAATAGKAASTRSSRPIFFETTNPSPVRALLMSKVLNRMHSSSSQDAVMGERA